VKTNNHFISVSRSGELMARRKGAAPVCVATVADGLIVQTDETARGRGAPPSVCVRFGHGGNNRELRVDAIELDGESLDVDAFCARFGVTDASFGRWIRTAVERALDAATGTTAR